MKKSDLAMIILIASASVMIAFFVVRAIPFFSAPDEGAEVPAIERISENLESPDPTVFNREAINPTVQSVIGGGSTNN